MMSTPSTTEKMMLEESVFITPGQVTVNKLMCSKSKGCSHFYKAQVSLDILDSAVRNVKMDFRHKLMMYKKMNE